MEKAERKKSKNTRKIILLVVLVTGVIIGFFKYREAQRYEKTDDAQLETDIVPVSARVFGYIDKVYFSDNQEVKKGDTLVILDDRDLRIKVEQAAIALDNAKATLGVTKANVNSTQEGGDINVFRIDELKIRLDKAEKDYERYKNLLSQGAATQQQFETAQANKEALEKQVKAAVQLQKEANSKTVTANEQVKVAENVVKQRQSDLNYAKLQLSYAIVIAPFDGMVSKRNAVPGQLVQAGQPLCSIVSSQNLWVVANFKETQINKMKPGMKVEVEVDAFSDKKITGKISSFASATGSKFSLIPPDNASGNFVKVVQRIPVIIELDKTNDTFKDLKPGMSVSVKVVLVQQ